MSSHTSTSSPWGSTSGTTVVDSLAELLDLLLDMVSVDVEFLGNLALQVQAHEIQAEDPGFPQLVVASEENSGEVVESLAGAVAQVALAIRLSVVPAIPDHRLQRATGASDEIGPPQGVMKNARHRLLCVGRRELSTQHISR